MITLKDNFRNDDFLCKISASWLNTVAKFYNKLELMYGEVIRCSDGKVILNPYYPPGSISGGGSTDFCWNVIGTALDITVTPGDIELGPDTVIAWGSITGHSTTVSATTGDSYLWIWVNVTVTRGSESAEMLSGTSITALNSTEKETILQKRIAKVTFVDDVVTKIERYQCGNIFIPRAA